MTSYSINKEDEYAVAGIWGLKKKKKKSTESLFGDL